MYMQNPEGHWVTLDGLAHYEEGINGPSFTTIYSVSTAYLQCLHMYTCSLDKYGAPDTE